MQAKKAAGLPTNGELLKGRIADFAAWMEKCFGRPVNQLINPLRISRLIVTPKLMPKK